MENWTDLILKIAEVCLIPILGVLTNALVKFINSKIGELKMRTENECLKKYIDMFNDTICDCVIATNQTYVESLKASGRFTIEAQKEAFEMTKNAVISLLTDEAKEYLTEIYGDLMNYMQIKIEAEVNNQKLVG